MNSQFNRQEIKSIMMQAYRDYQAAVDPDKCDFNGNQFVQFMVMLSIAQSLLVIADNLTAMRFDGSIAVNIESVRLILGDIYEVLDRRMP